MKQPLVSVVMPAWNVEKYIGQAIESVLAQTYPNWELVIVDDASTDRTPCIVEQYLKKESRIKYYCMPVNSGSARLPRHKAVALATGEWIVSLDADDYLDNQDLEKLELRANETDADIVLQRTVAVGGEGKETLGCLPKQDFDMRQVFAGKEACMKTIVHWEISASGAFVRRNLFLKTLDENKDCYMNSDEVDTRRLFLSCNKIAFADAVYFYRANPASITRRFSMKRFDVLETDKLLDGLIKDAFGNSTPEYKRMQQQRMNNLVSLMYLFVRNQASLSLDQRNEVLSRLKHHYQDTHRRYYQASLLKKCLFATNWHLFYAVMRTYNALKPKA